MERKALLNFQELFMDDKINALKGLKKLIGKEFTGKKNIALKAGDIVLDEKNKEYGIIVGIKPKLTGDQLISVLGSDKEIEKIHPSGKSKDELLVLLTISTNAGIADIRLRYTSSKYVMRIESDNKVNEEVNLIKSLVENHCQGECILDCDSCCSLWKYKK